MKEIKHTQKLNGNDIYDYIISGAEKIINNENTLNSINVFPVADNDTGSNLAYTMKCIIANSNRYENVSETLSSISSVALEDSYGNSGAIFASFFHGLSEGAYGKTNLSLSEFSQISNNAVNYAYEALAAPIEGTILTVIKDWAAYLNDNHLNHFEFKTLILEATKYAKESLLKTKNQLKVLSESNVVDAGALGFIYFLEGIKDYFLFGEVVITEARHIHKHHNHLEAKYQYCTEFVIEVDDIFSKKELQQILALTDDSIIVQRIGSFYKIHTHTDFPHIAAETVQKYGKIIKSKVDDMHLQVKIANSDKSPIGIITDSIADIPKEWISKYKLMQIPLQLILDGNVYSDRLTLKNDKLFSILNKTKKPATSSQSSLSYIEKSFNMMLENFDHVIGIFVSSQMSGLYQKVLAAAKKVDSKNLHIIDSKMNSGSQALLVHTAIESIKSNETIDVILEKLKNNLSSYNILVQIPDLEYATLSGRVPKIVGNIANVFNLKAIISIDKDGKGIVTKELNLAKAIRKNAKKKKFLKYGLVYTGSPKELDDIRKTMKDLTGEDPIFIEEVSNIVSAFIGLGAVGIAYQEEV